MLPTGFTYLNDPRMIYIMSYATPHNFMGCIVDGYQAPVCIATEAMANALINVQNILDQLKKNYRLKIFDTYRPAVAVEHFERWAMDIADQKMKTDYYPDLDKRDLFKLGYIAKKSGHSRGSTVDLTITVAAHTHEADQELDMGTPFDFFGENSHTANPNISTEAKRNRLMLKELMEAQGLENYPQEWWHFTLKNEPFPDTYFNFEVK